MNTTELRFCHTHTFAQPSALRTMTWGCRGHVTSQAMRIDHARQRRVCTFRISTGNPLHCEVPRPRQRARLAEAMCPEPPAAIVDNVRSPRRAHADVVVTQASDATSAGRGCARDPSPWAGTATTPHGSQWRPPIEPWAVLLGLRSRTRAEITAQITEFGQLFALCADDPPNGDSLPTHDAGSVPELTLQSHYPVVGCTSCCTV